MPQSTSATSTAASPYLHQLSEINADKGAPLYSLLHRRGLVGEALPAPAQKTRLYDANNITDLSNVYPQMFVRVHDIATGKDLPGSDLEHDYLSTDVSRRTSVYEKAYQELRNLTDIFRAYVASVRVIRQRPQICGAVHKLPITPGEQLSTPLPEYRPSEILFAIARVGWREGKKSLFFPNGFHASTVEGGIALRGKAYSTAATISQQTAVATEVDQDLTSGIPAPTWKDQSGRQYVALVFDQRKPPRRVPIMAGNSSE